MSKSDVAKELFLNGANCAQAVLGAFHEECGITLEQAMKTASGFGAGMARMREVCGTVSGMFLAANMIAGPSDPADNAAKEAHYVWLQELADEFRKENGSIICRELLGLSSTQKPLPRKRTCAELASYAAGLLEQSLAKRNTGK